MVAGQSLSHPSFLCDLAIKDRRQRSSDAGSAANASAKARQAGNDRVIGQPCGSAWTPAPLQVSAEQRAERDAICVNRRVRRFRQPPACVVFSR